MRRILIAVAALAVVAFVAASALQQPSLPDFSPSGEAQPLPVAGEFVGVDQAEFEGILVGLKGRPVVVNVWASWCGPCRAEMPLLQAAAASYDGKAVILGVAANDDPDSAQAFLNDLGISYPNTFDSTGAIHDVLDVRAFPTTYVFGVDGTLRSRVSGGISEQRLAGLIDDALR